MTKSLECQRPRSPLSALAVFFGKGRDQPAGVEKNFAAFTRPRFDFWWGSVILAYAISEPPVCGQVVRLSFSLTHLNLPTPALLGMRCRRVAVREGGLQTRSRAGSGINPCSLAGFVRRQYGMGWSCLAGRWLRDNFEIIPVMHFLKLQRADIAQRRMSPSAVII